VIIIFLGLLVLVVGGLVITDQTMPNMTGLQLSGRLRQIRPDIPIILCTGFSENANEEVVKTHQINAFVMKPLLKKDIARVIRNVLDQKNILS
jgi:YesN/AraC family two-component response regulator